jgi:succinate dehydrogenase/fumarate reductase flavoprotein subunit
MTIEPAKERDCDVLICGGGTAGVAAAVAAARSGARTILMERYGFCGGICVGSLVHTLDGLRSCRDYSQYVVGGIGREMVDRMVAARGMATGDNPPECVTFDPEAFKLIADDILEEAGVETLFHLKATHVERRGPLVESVIAAGKEGLWRVRARQIVDATGDGDASAYAGAAFEKDGLMQTMSMHFRIGGVDAGVPWDVLEHSARRAMDAAYAAGHAPKYGGPWIIRIREGEVTANCTRLYGDGTSTVDLSKAEVQGRRDMMSILGILRECAPGFSRAYLLASGCSIGVRETRRILGDYQITAQDILECRPADDVIAIGSWPIDIHPADGRVGVHPHKENPPAPYPIPAGCVIVRDFDNLLTAGRCISATHEAHGSTRVSGTAMALGQAAGTIAAMAAEQRVAARAVPIASVQDGLLAAGAILSLP